MLLDEMSEDLVQSLTDIFQNNISIIILYGSVARNAGCGRMLHTDRAIQDLVEQIIYAIFHAMRSAKAIKGFDLSKHSG